MEIYVFQANDLFWGLKPDGLARLGVICVRNKNPFQVSLAVGEDSALTCVEINVKWRLLKSNHGVFSIFDYHPAFSGIVIKS